MPCCTCGQDLDVVRHLSRSRYADPAHTPIFIHLDAAAFVQRELGIDLVPMILNQELDSSLASPFFVALVQQDHVPIELDALALDGNGGHGACNGHPFVIQCASTQDIAIANFPAEWIESPLVAFYGHH